MVELIDKHLLFGSRILDPVRLAAYGQEVDVNADQLCCMRVAQARGRDPAPIPALHREALVAERISHELGKSVRQLLDAEALLPRPEREAIARQRGRDDCEGVGRVAAEA